jgi:hypothetical protein
MRKHYIALVHKDEDSDFGVSFPDFPGAVTAAPTLDDAVKRQGRRSRCTSKAWPKMASPSRLPPASPRPVSENPNLHAYLRSAGI